MIVPPGQAGTRAGTSTNQENFSQSVLQTLSPMEHQCVNLDRSFIRSAEHCILEHLKGPQAKVLMFKNMRRGQQADPEIYFGMMANINRTVCILENVGIFSCNVQIVDNLWGGDSQASWPEKQQGRAVTHLGCDTFGMWGCLPPVLTSMPLAPQHISYSDCLRQWEPPTRSHLLRVWVLLLGAFSCPCHSPDLPCPHWMGLTTTPSWDMGTRCVLARGMVGDAA